MDTIDSQFEIAKQKVLDLINYNVNIAKHNIRIMANTSIHKSEVNIYFMTSRENRKSSNKIDTYSSNFFFKALLYRKKLLGLIRYNETRIYTLTVDQLKKSNEILETKNKNRQRNILYIGVDYYSTMKDYNKVKELQEMLIKLT